jgi:hypothetical protein
VGLGPIWEQVSFDAEPAYCVLRSGFAKISKRMRMLTCMRLSISMHFTYDHIVCKSCTTVAECLLTGFAGAMRGVLCDNEALSVTTCDDVFSSIISDLVSVMFGWTYQLAKYSSNLYSCLQSAISISYL